MKLLIVDDDKAGTRKLSKELDNYRCVVDVAPDSVIGLGMIQQWEYDAILLSFNLPGQDSVHFCRQLRQQGCAILILMLLPQRDTDAAVRSLEAGADDCAPKLTETRLLLARLRALYRRSTQKLSDSSLCWGALELDSSQFSVSYCDEPIHLSAREYKLLELFLQHPKRVFTRDAILDKLWPIDQPPSAAAVTNLVKDVRRKLREAGIAGQPISTVHGLGYQLGTPSAMTVESAAQKIDRTHQPYLQESLHPLVDTFQQHLQSHLAVIDSLTVALQRDALTLAVQQQVRAVAYPFAVMLDILGYSQASNILRTIDYLLASSLPLPSGELERLGKLLKQLYLSLEQGPSHHALAALPRNVESPS